MCQKLTCSHWTLLCKSTMAWVLLCDQKVPDMCCLQAPYTIEVTGPTYVSLLEIANAEVLGNITNGTLDLRVTESYQNLEPDFGNMVNVTLTLATDSQVCEHYLFSERPWAAV